MKAAVTHWRTTLDRDGRSVRGCGGGAGSRSPLTSRRSSVVLVVWRWRHRLSFETWAGSVAAVVVAALGCLRPPAAGLAAGLRADRAGRGPAHRGHVEPVRPEQGAGGDRSSASDQVPRVLRVRSGAVVG